MANHLKDGEVAVVFVPKFREYGIWVLDGGNSYVQIDHCPWCGDRLPGGLRDEWFDHLEAMGLEPDDPRIPQKFLTEEWWLGKKN